MPTKTKRQLNEEIKILKGRLEKPAASTAVIEPTGTLEDSIKVRDVEITNLKDSIIRNQQTTDTQIAQLQDSLTKSDAAFLTVKAELAQLNDRPVSDGMVLDFINNRIDEDTWQKIGKIKQFGLATVEDSGKSCREALLAAIKWLENIKKYSAEAKDIMLNTIADKVGLNELKAAAGAKLSDTPQPEDELKPRIPGTPVLPDAETKPEEKPEETAPVEDSKKEYRISKYAILTTKSSQSHYGKPVLRVTGEDGKTADYGPGDLTGYFFEPEQTYGDVVAKILSGHSWNKENKWEHDLMKAFLSQSPKYANVEDTAPVEDSNKPAEEDSPGWLWYKEFTKKLE